MNLIKRYIGIIGLLFVFSIVTSSITSNSSDSIMFLGEVTGFFIGLLLFCSLFTLVPFFISLVIGKKVKGEIFFYIFTVSSLLSCCSLTVGLNRESEKTGNLVGTILSPMILSIVLFVLGVVIFYIFKDSKKKDSNEFTSDKVSIKNTQEISESKVNEKSLEDRKKDLDERIKNFQNKK